MKLWTLQHTKAYERLMKTGVLRANEEYLFCQNDFRHAYHWISEEMTRRIGIPPDSVHYPIWLWYKWEGKYHRPDMRSFGRNFCEKDTPITLLSVEIPESMVLLSDFDMWHIVLLDSYLAISEEDEANPTLSKKESWKRIFDFTIKSDYWNLEDRSIQATVWEIEKHQICNAEHFITR